MTSLRITTDCVRECLLTLTEVEVLTLGPFISRENVCWPHCSVPTEAEQHTKF